MTRNVFSGTLNPTQPDWQWLMAGGFCVILYLHIFLFLDELYRRLQNTEPLHMVI